MDPPHPLKALLQLQLPSDSYAVHNLPYVLSSLTPAALRPSPHIQKWIARISSLLYSKDPGARWAGLCIAHETSIHSKSIIIDCAQTWLAVALPLLSRNEPVPTLKASIRLLRQIFISATEVPEFQRRIATPNIPKFSAALISLTDKQHDRVLKALCLNTLTRLITFYPTLHRAQHAAMHALTLKLLNGSTPLPTDTLLLQSASGLYSVLHHTGGKVGAVNLWRKSLDDTLAFSRSAFECLRTTFPIPSQGKFNSNANGGSTEDPAIWIPLNIDRLRCGVYVLRDLLRSNTQRPAQLPTGPLVGFVLDLLSVTGVTAEDQGHGHVDHNVRSMEVAAIPFIWKYGCDLLIHLTNCAKHHVTSSQSRLLGCISYHLEQPLSSSERLPFLEATQALLTHTHLTHSITLPNRLAKALIPSLGVVLATKSDLQRSEEGEFATLNGNKNRKGKKRAREYEGDEVFNTGKKVVCSSGLDEEVLIVALEATRLVMGSPQVSPAVSSIISRILLSMLLVLPHISPTLLSSNAAFHIRLLGRVRELCVKLGSGTQGVMSKTLGVVLQSNVMHEGKDTSAMYDLQQQIDILLHPRVPPLLRSLPHVESLSLFRAEESIDEVEVREALGLEYANQNVPGSKATTDVGLEPGATVQPFQKQTPPRVPTSTVSKPQNSKPSAPEETQQTLRPPPDLLPSSFLEEAHTTTTPISTAPVSVQPPVQVPIVSVADKEEDEDMPSIDMNSDSD